MKKLFLVLSLVTAALLGACSSPSATELDAIPKSQPASIAAIASTAKGFVVGATESAQTVYVFFDAQCPHCGHLWDAAKPLWPHVRFGWVPVAFINKASLAQGAALLSADNPALRMDEHEASLLAHQGGMTAGAVSPELRLTLEKNTKLLTSFGADSIPYIVAVNAQGKLVSAPGSLSTKELANLLGVPFEGAATAAPAEAPAAVSN